MKGDRRQPFPNREHRIPLCRRAVEVLDAARTLGDSAGPLVFTGDDGEPLDGKVLRRRLERQRVPAIPYRFRSSFRDWAAEETEHRREVIEAAVAHVVGKKVETAYARSGLFERRGPAAAAARRRSCPVRTGPRSRRRPAGRGSRRRRPAAGRRRCRPPGALSGAAAPPPRRPPGVPAPRRERPAEPGPGSPTTRDARRRCRAAERPRRSLWRPLTAQGSEGPASMPAGALRASSRVAVGDRPPRPRPLRLLPQTPQLTVHRRQLLPQPGVRWRGEGPGLKGRSWVEATRRRWARLVNAHLERAGRPERITAENRATRIERAEAAGDRATAEHLRRHPPGRHLGPAAAAIERDGSGRAGQVTERGELARATAAETARQRVPPVPRPDRPRDAGRPRPAPQRFQDFLTAIRPSLSPGRRAREHDRVEPAGSRLGGLQYLQDGDIRTFYWADPGAPRQVLLTTSLTVP